MGGSVEVCIDADVFKADLAANDRAAAIVAQDIIAAAGSHADDGGLVLGKGGQRLDAAVKVCHQLIDLAFHAEQGSDGGGVLAHALDHTDLGVDRR